MPAKFDSTALLDQLQLQVKGLSSAVEEKLLHLPAQVLQLPPAQDKWSAVQCLEHLNTYSRFYLPHLATAIQLGRARQLPPVPVFKSSWLGNLFTRLMQPKPDGSLPVRMPAPKNARPVPGLDAAPVLNEFMVSQQQLLQLLEMARSTSLQQLKVPTSLNDWLKFSLGDTFRFFIAHEERHVQQALRAVGA
ncbi:DinB family protein [Chitinophaga japonensis]|uniref:DinB family protein n=1 Tax=Chitinophaga japonensis TaxID=104662 RepID=A0A562TDW0_CHIJA|nr:DinB family protein [Chitinophaga japonensis]TWI91434.1 DinB family protein [Chitinophaga japonensis]